MSDTVDNVLNTVEESEPAEDVVVSESTSLVNEEETSVEEEAPVASETEEAPVASEVEEAPVASETEETPVASETEEAPVASEVEEAPVASETEEASVEPEVVPIEQVVSDIRDILSEGHDVVEDNTFTISSVEIADIINDQNKSIYILECNINYYIEWINEEIGVDVFINRLNNLSITNNSTSEKNLSNIKFLVDKLIKNIIKLECIKDNTKCKNLYNILLSYNSIERFDINDIHNINDCLKKIIYYSLIHYSWKLNKKDKYKYVNMINF